MEMNKTRIIVDDMILTKDVPTTAGSKMLEGYVSLFEAEVLTRLKDAGCEMVEKADVGEFSIDLVGETSCHGAWINDGKLVSAASAIIGAAEADVAICLDVNGAPRRAAAQSGLVFVKPTYGTVSRYGTIPVACSGETVGVMAKDTDTCRDILGVISGHDDKDGTSLSEEQCAYLKERSSTPTPCRVALLTSMMEGVDAEVSAKIDDFVGVLTANGIEVCKIDDEIIAASRAAWNILMSAELCNNVSRYDGVKYGYRSNNFTNIDELYTNSRTEAFGELLKTAILFGSDTLSTENYMKVYDKALRVRRLVCEAFAKLFDGYDAVLLPVCSTMQYTEDQVKDDKYKVYRENLYTAPASISGLPAIVVGGVQLVGAAFSENMLFELARVYEKEGK